jgi:hypothetical protein
MSLATDTTCAFCGGSPDDWCPGCLSLMCDLCSGWHAGSLDGACTQAGHAVAQQFVCGGPGGTEQP